MVMEDVSRLARAVEANWCAAWASLGAVADRPPTLVDDRPEFLRICTPGIPEMLMNTVLRYASAAPVSPSDVERVIAPYRRHHLPFQWWMVIGDEPEGLRHQLHRLHMLSCGGATCMALALSDRPPPHLNSPPMSGEAIGPAETAEDGRAVLALMCDVFYLPPGPMARWTIDNPAFQLYLTRLAGHPVCALAVLRAGTTVGVYNVATRPGYRRRGLAGRLLGLALGDARMAGADLATLTATPEARPLYETLGFRTCGAIEQWIPGPDLQARLTVGGRPPHARGGGW